MEVILVVSVVSWWYWEHGHHQPSKPIDTGHARLFQAPLVVSVAFISNFLVKKEKRERGERVARKLPINTPNTIEQCKDLPKHLILMKNNSMVSGAATPSQHPLNNLHTPV